MSDQGSAATAPDGTAASTPGSGSVELLDQLRRERADFRNFKRRAEQDRAEDRTRERAVVLTSLLPVLDELDRALGQVPPRLAQDPWARGVALGRGGLAAGLEQL